MQIARERTAVSCAAWRGKIGLSAADIFHADGSGKGGAKISSGIPAKDRELKKKDKTCINL